jgi:hypothetical protein
MMVLFQCIDRYDDDDNLDFIIKNAMIERNECYELQNTTEKMQMAKNMTKKLF